MMAVEVKLGNNLNRTVRDDIQSTDGVNWQTVGMKSTGFPGTLYLQRY